MKKMLVLISVMCLILFSIITCMSPNAVFAGDSDSSGVEDIAVTDTKTASLTVPYNTVTAAEEPPAFDIVPSKALKMMSGTESVPVAGFGKTIEFDGTNYVEIPINSSHNITNHFTVEFWYKPASLDQPGSYLLSRNGKDPSQQWAVIFGSVNDMVEFYSHPNGYIGINPRNDSQMMINDTAWHHIAYSYDSTNWKGYLDGEQIFSVSRNFTLKTCDNYLYIGGTVGSSGATAETQGRIDEVRIWRKGLSGQTIANWMYREVDSTHPNYEYLVDYYKLNEGAGAVVIDTKGGINGTFVNGQNSHWQPSDIQQWTTDEDIPVTGKLVGSDPDGSSTTGEDWSLTFEIVSNGTKGIAAVTSDNEFVYTPNKNENGSDTFTYRVQDANGNYSEPHRVNINMIPVADSDKAIRSFDFFGLEPAVAGTIDEEAKTVKLIVPFGTDLTSLVPTIVHNGEGILPESAVAQDFTSPVIYTVTAEDGSTQDYTVIVENPLSYTVTFVNWDDSVLKTETAAYGTPATAPEAPSREGYTFTGWNLTYDNVTSDLIITALFEIKSFNLNYNGNGATGGTAPANISCEYKSTVTVAGNTGNLTKTGYNFSGWNTKADGSGTSYTEGMIFLMEAADVTLYTKWTAISSGRGSSGGSHQTPPSNNVPVTVGGQTQQQTATATIQTQDGRTVTTVTLDAERLTETIHSSQIGSNIAISINSYETNAVVSELNGQLVKTMESKQAKLEIKTDAANYILPAQQINIDAVSEQFGQGLKLSDIMVSIEIAKSSDETVKIAEDAASDGNFSIVVPPIEFTVKCTYGDQTINVSQFSSYVERTVAIPDDVDPQKITTAVVIESDGTVRHVPTKIIVMDGKYYVRINSLTNSTYSVIWNPIDFKDAAVHWAEEAIQDMGSRMVISGVGNDTFEPDRAITRAEFAAVIVRALGLKPDLGQNMFRDVPSDAWYSSYVMIASEYRIISGYGDGKFGPNNKITREQAMVMAARAMNITELKVEFASDEVEKLLQGYKDADKFAGYARNSIAACIKAGVANGKNDKLIAPKGNITRAEVAVMIQRLLQKSNLI